MSASTLPPANGASLARKAREHFVAKAQECLAPLGKLLRARLMELANMPAGAREMQDRRDAMLEFERKGNAFLEGTGRSWRKAIEPPTATMRVRLEAMNLELVDEVVVDRKILASRLALLVQEKASWDLNDLKVRMQHLDGEEQASTDVLRPEAFCQLLVEQWGQAGLSRANWDVVQDVVKLVLVEHVPGCYASTNEFLVSHGVMPEIELASRVRRGAGGSVPGGRGSSEDGESRGTGPASMPGPAGRPATGPGAGLDGDPDWTEWNDSAPAASAGARGGARTGVLDETRLMTAAPPLARARQRASGVLGQLRRLLTDKVKGYDPASPPTQPSPGLAAALRPGGTTVHDTVAQLLQGGGPGAGFVYDDAAVEEVAVDLRRRTVELKQKAGTSAEKATIEIVALMFQSILAEERIPPGIRVWVARLQMPVLRVAIAEPEFFSSLEHPARQLIDRMGSCVLGFSASSVNGSALEAEIKRVVQVIEQYPETGRRVFELVYAEFEKFLARFLTEQGATQKLVSVAQQVEQKETLAIQYTIEMRKMLADLPVREEIREFLFKVWTEVLALAAVRHGAQHEETLALKSAATELIWAAGAKPNRQERARVIEELPALLQRLRAGMALVGMAPEAQESQIKTIGDTLADAFMSRTESIPRERVEAMARRLVHLEDFVEDAGGVDLPLDRESVEMMLGMDASGLEVVADGGSRPSAGMLAWATELQVGHWFTLDHNGAIHQVQYVWRSERRQLHLFASADGRSFLVQLRRLGAYLQAGLLLPAEEEALTVRATRDALAKLDANPERLLQ